jgi:site-specific DNA-methyltransferase (adenine-specific)
MIFENIGEDSHKIFCGDCLEVMKQISDESVDLVVTSPPYGLLRDYKGYSFSVKDIS